MRINSCLTYENVHSETSLYIHANNLVNNYWQPVIFIYIIINIIAYFGDSMTKLHCHHDIRINISKMFEDKYLTVIFSTDMHFTGHYKHEV